MLSKKAWLMTNLLTLVSWMQNAASIQQIFYSSTLNSIDFNRSFMGFDTEQRIYPVIMETANCPFFPLKSCPLSKFDWDNMEESCSLNSKCPKGTQPSCVENNENEPRLVLMICSPIQQCERDARNIVLLDQNKPNASTYQIIKIPFQDGFIHPQGNDCFSQCQEIHGIKLFRKSTPQKGPIAFCDYQMDYCNAEGPNLFELVDLTSPCYPAYTRGHNTCRAGYERKLDCTCQPRCKDEELRDPEDDFKCKHRSDRIALENIMHVIPYVSGFCFEWNIPQSKDLIVDSVQLAYRSSDDIEERIITQELANVTRGSTDVNGLFSGILYSISANFKYTYKEMSLNASRKLQEATRPKPVMNLTLTVVGGDVILHWAAPTRSWQDHYIVEHRAIRRNPYMLWKSSKTPNVTFTLHDTFPGEEYEFKVFGVSNGTYSTEKTAVLIVPPLSPEELSQHFEPNTLTIKWFHDEKRSHVEEYRLNFDSSSGRHEQRGVSTLKSSRIEVTFSSIRPGETYSASVQSRVADVFSMIPATVNVTIPKVDIGGEIHWSTYLIIVLVALIFIVVVVIVIILLRKNNTDAPAVVHEINRIGRYIVHNICRNGDMVIQYGDSQPPQTLRNYNEVYESEPFVQESDGS